MASGLKVKLFKVRGSADDGITVHQWESVEHTWPNHSHPEYKLGVSEGGTGTFFYRGQRYFTGPGKLLVIHPNEVHSCTATFTYQASDGDLPLSNSATVTITVSAPSSNTMFVADIRFQSKRGNKDWRVTFEVRDQDGNPLEGVTVRYTFAGSGTIEGTTGADGTFTTPWQRNLGRGPHFAEVVDLVIGTHDWNKDLDLQGDSDGDGLPDAWS